MGPSASVERQARDLTVRGVRMRAVEAGRGNGPPLVLLHGFWVSHAAWDDVLEPLATRFHVIAPDLPGFGDSEKPSPSRYQYGLEAFTESIADLLAAFGVGRVHCVGHAMGGAVALTLAAKHAELVDQLVVVDPLSYPFPMTLRARVPLYPVVGPFVFKQLFGRGTFRSFFRNEVFSDGVEPDWSRVDHHYDRFNQPAARESAYATMRAMLDTRPLVARLGRVRSKTLVVWGRGDRIFPVTHAAKLVKELRDAHLEILDAGHSPAEERPEQFLSVVTEFLEGRR